MRSDTNILRVSLLLLLFSAFNLKTNVHASGSELILNDRTEAPLVHGKPPCNDQLETIVSNMPGKKLAPMTITLIVNNYQSRIAQIIWITSAPGIPGTYFVERQVELSGVWDVIKQVPFDSTLAYNDTISYPYCSTPDNPSYNFLYRVRFGSVSGLDNDTSASTGYDLSDLTSPATVQNLNVSLGNSASGFNPLLTWSEIKNDSIFYYLIQRYNGFQWESIGSAPADTNRFNDYTALQVCDTSYKYIILTFDLCGNTSNKLYEDYFVQTIKLDIAPPGPCDSIAKLSWNSPHAMPGGLGGYTIYRTDDTSAIKFDTQDTSYIDNSNLEKGHTYIYSVKANSLNGTDTSSSCQVVWLFNPVAIDQVYITQVSVEADSYISAGYHFSPPGSVEKLILERSDDGCANFHAVDSLTGSGGVLSQDSFINDTTADVHKQSYCYRMVAIDSCGNEITSINTAQSIYLQCSSSQTQNTLTWNSYESWLRGVEGYQVFRNLDGQAATVEMIGSVSPATNTFTDLLTDVDPSKMACYWVVAAENPLNPYLPYATSTSNTFCVIKEPLFFMPNAFYPEGNNKYFRPVQTPAFVDPQSFTMTIFNRWGQQLFETNDMALGWNGSVNGQYAPAGLYAYILTYKSLDGKEYTKRGTAFLVR